VDAKGSAAYAAAATTSSRCLWDGQYFLPGSGTRWHAVPFRVLAWQTAGLPSNGTPVRSRVSTNSVASVMCSLHTPASYNAYGTWFLQQKCADPRCAGGSR
jgi:hypothetical protein